MNIKKKNTTIIKNRIFVLTFGRFSVTVFVCASARTYKRIISVKDSGRVFAHSAMMLPKIELNKKLSGLSHTLRYLDVRKSKSN